MIRYSLTRLGVWKKKLRVAHLFAATLSVSFSPRAVNLKVYAPESGTECRLRVLRGPINFWVCQRVAVIAETSQEVMLVAH